MQTEVCLLLSFNWNLSGSSGIGVEEKDGSPTLSYNMKNKMEIKKNKLQILRFVWILYTQSSKKYEPDHSKIDQQKLLITPQ